MAIAHSKEIAAMIASGILVAKRMLAPKTTFGITETTMTTSIEPHVTRFTVVDLETENRNVPGNSPVGKNPSYQWHPDNYILAIGIRTYSIELTSEFKYRLHADPQWKILSFKHKPAPNLPDIIRGHMLDTNSSHIVFHNAAFDLQWLMRNNLKHTLSLMFHDSDPRVRIWDTMHIAYMLTGNHCRMLGLGKLYDMCEKVDRVLKDNDYLELGKDGLIKEYSDKGMFVSDIPETTLMEYLKRDLDTTAYCFATLMTGEMDARLKQLMEHSHQALCSTAWMAFNGMWYLKDKSRDIAEQIDHLSVTSIRRAAHTHVTKLLDATGIAWLLSLPNHKLVTELTSFITSNHRLSSLLFGGTLKVSMPKPVLDEHGNEVIFKSGVRKGKVKTRLEPLELTLPMLINPDKHNSERTSTSSDHFKIDEAVLQSILKHASYARDFTAAEPIRKIVEEVLDYRKYNKITSTYLGKLPDLCAYDGCIHPNMHHSITATGRLSSSGPNLQNIAASPDNTLPIARVKRYFVSRYENGVLVEADYSQLEVVIMAVLSNDTNLLQDLLMGVDIHRANAMALYGLAHESEVTDAQRRLAKVLSFELQYGAGAPSMARAHGIPEHLALRFIQTYFLRYPKVKEWHDSLIETYRKKSLASRRNRIIIPTPTGRRLSYFPTERGGPPTTKLKNYPVQSVATADLVPIGISHACEAIFNSDLKGVLPINTIHDSILLDICSIDLLPAVAQILHTTLVSDTLVAMRRLGVDIPEALLKIDIKFGHNWDEMAHYPDSPRY